MSDSQPVEHWPDARLIREANRGNTQAFVTLCVRSLPSLLRYARFQCNSLGVPIDLADDFCHDAIIKAVDHINSCKEHGHRPLPCVSVAWLKQIAFNTIRDWMRRDSRFTQVDEIEVEARPTVSVDDVEEYEEILKFFDWLGPNERDMLEMVLVDGKDVVEAGAEINLAKWAAYKTYYRGLEHLRDILQEHGTFAPAWLAS